jgi:hypothetical protein
MNPIGKKTQRIKQVISNREQLEHTQRMIELE